MSDPEASFPAPARELPAAAIRCSGLGRRFQKRWALAHLDLELPTGRATVIAGANGSGKTTFLRCCAGLCQPTSGSLTVDGRDVVQAPKHCRPLVSLVSHRGFLYPGLTAVETAELWLRLVGANHSQGSHDVHDRASELLAEVGLEHARDLDVDGFSQGMRKRLSLLRTRIEDPRIVLLDEPFAALDPEGQQLVCDWIERFVSEGRTVVFASHAIERSSALATHAVLLHRGQLVWQGAASRLPEAVERLAQRTLRSNSAPAEPLVVEQRGESAAPQNEAGTHRG